MNHKITEKSFYKYIKCPTWVYFDVQEGEQLVDPLLDKLVQDGLMEEKEREILADREDLAEVMHEDPEDAYNQTLEFMKAGRQTIYHGTLMHKYYIGSPDVFERVEGKSKFGDYYYVAADLKRALSMRDDYKFQGCFYAELLEKIQGVRPVQGYVINANKQIFEYQIDEFEAEYHLTLDGIERIIAGKEPAHFVTSGCKQSPWFSKCTSISESCDDLSMLNRVWRKEVKGLQDAGIHTIPELAKKTVVELQSLVPDLSQDRLEILRDKALAIRDNKHIIRHKVDFPESDIELFFDIESDPLRDHDYLFGVLKVSQEGEEYFSFFSDSKADEEKMWKEFISFVESHMDAPMYHYGDFEWHVLEHFSKRFGASELVRDAFSHNMIDLQVITRDAVVFPLSFYSLKDLAKYTGFNWRTEGASGAESVLWFEEWLRTKEDDMLQKILDYNEDDVIATWKLQRWLRENASL
ncbi:MAG: TM0106 family RecB-like putative nuclease [Patescibacteria group bacterium]